MSLITILCGICIIHHTYSQVYVGNGVGFGPNMMPPFPNIIPPLMFLSIPMPQFPMPQFPMPYMPMYNTIHPAAPIVSRNNFVSEDSTVNHIPADPYRGYKHTSTLTSTNAHPSKTQTVIDSRINDDDGSATHTVHSSHTSTFKSPKGGSSSHTVITQTSNTPDSSSVSGGSAHTDVQPTLIKTGGEAETEINPIITSNGGTAETNLNPSYTQDRGTAETSYVNNGGNSHTHYQPNYSNSYVGGGSSYVSQMNYGSGHPSTFGTSTYTSSSNINGQGYHETVSSVNNNGNVQTYRQFGAKR